MTFRELVVLGAGKQSAMPKDYDRAQFPLHLLMACLDPEHELHRTTTHFGIRERDMAAAAIQAFSGHDFGLSSSGDAGRNDRAIERIRAWWQRRNRP
jgi:hypothetical protein